MPADYLAMFLTELIQPWCDQAEEDIRNSIDPVLSVVYRKSL
jgi:hypothetical protein